ncbi:MAG: DUF4352 domain-containing protein [Nitrososphaerota archaeon]
MNPRALLVVFLVVGLIIGLGVGGVAFTSTTTTTKYETIMSTIHVTSILTTLLEKIITTSITTTLSPVAQLSTVTETQRVTSTVTLTATVWPKFSPEGKIGDEVGEKGLVFKIYGSEEKWKLGMFEPQSGNKFIVIDIEVKNVYPEEKSVGTVFMYVVDGEGKRYGSSMASVGITGYFRGGTLKPGETMRGYVAFEVPATSTPKYFVYEDLIERYASIALQ